MPFSAFKRIVIDGFREYERNRLLIEKRQAASRPRLPWHAKWVALDNDIG